jgi:hypothetical protein
MRLVRYRNRASRGEQTPKHCLAFDPTKGVCESEPSMGDGHLGNVR